MTRASCSRSTTRDGLAWNTPANKATRVAPADTSRRWSTDGLWVISVSTARTSRPASRSSAASFSTRSPWTSASTSRPDWSSAASRRATAAPIPCAAPTTTVVSGMSAPVDQESDGVVGFVGEPAVGLGGARGRDDVGDKRLGRHGPRGQLLQDPGGAADDGAAVAVAVARDLPFPAAAEVEVFLEYRRQHRAGGYLRIGGPRRADGENLAVRPAQVDGEHDTSRPARALDDHARPASFPQIFPG